LMGELVLRSTFQVEHQHKPLYSGGSICIGTDGVDGFFNAGGSFNHVDLTTGRVVQNISTSGDIDALCFHPETQQLLVSTTSLLISHYLLDKPNLTLQRQWKAHTRPITNLAFHPSGRYAASASTDHTARVWDVQQGFCTHNFKGHEGIVTLVRFHPNKSRMELFTASEDGNIRVWDLDTKRCKILSSHMSVPTSLCFSSSGKELISVGRDQVINFWNLSKYELIRTIPAFEPLEGIFTVPENLVQKIKETKSVKGPLVITGGEKGLLKIWDCGSSECVFTESNPDSKEKFKQILDANDGKHIILVTEEDNLMFYSLENLPLQSNKLLVGSLDEIIDMKYIQGGKSLVVATNTSKLYTFDLATFSCNALLGHKDTILCVDVSPDGRLIASASKDNTIRIWDNQTRKCIAEGVGHTESVMAIGFAKRTGEFVISAGQDKTLKLWNIKAALKANSTGSIIPLKSKFTVKAHDKEINAVSVAPNDSLFASGSQDKLIKLWDPKGQLIATLKGHKRGIWALEFSPVDKVLASASGDKTVKIWSLSDHSCLRTFEGHTHAVLKLCWITRGMQLLSCGSDGLVKLWTLKSNECTNTFEQHEDRIWALACKDDGDQFVTGDSGSLLNVWKDHTIFEQEKEQLEKEKLLLDEQKLSNFLHEKNYHQAILLAFELEQPFRIRSIFADLLSGPDAGVVDDIVKEFSEDTLKKSLHYIRDWNTNARHSVVAQEVLSRIVRVYPPKQLLKIQGMKQILQALLPYTDRHFQRLDQLLQKSCIIDFTLQRMNLLTPDDADESAISLGDRNQNTSTSSQESEDSDESMDSQDNDDSPVVVTPAPLVNTKRKFATPGNTAKRKKLQ